MPLRCWLLLAESWAPSKFILRGGALAVHASRLKCYVGRIEEDWTAYLRSRFWSGWYPLSRIHGFGTLWLKIQEGCSKPVYFSNQSLKVFVASIQHGFIFSLTLYVLNHKSPKSTGRESSHLVSWELPGLDFSTSYIRFRWDWGWFWILVIPLMLCRQSFKFHSGTQLDRGDLHETYRSRTKSSICIPESKHLLGLDLNFRIVDKLL
jgi:hypothetical protein